MPLYAQLLGEAAQRLGATEAFYRLWPITMPPVPWLTVVINFYSEVQPPHAPLRKGLHIGLWHCLLRVWPADSATGCKLTSNY